MSLLNDALTDLDSRRQHLDIEPLMNNSESRDSNYIYRRVFVVFSISIVTFLTVFFGHEQRFYKDSKQEEFVSIPTDFTEGIAKISLEEESNVLANKLIEDSVENLEREKQDPNVEAYLVLANYALSNDRLTKPENNNAYYFFKKILSIDEKNQIAIDGIEKLRSRYRKLTEESLKSGAINKAKRMIARAHTISIDQYWIIEKNEEVLSYENLLLVEKQESNEAVDRRHDRTVKMTKTLKERQADFLNTINQLKRENKHQEAISKLEEFIAMNPESIKVGVALFDEYIYLGDVNLAKKLYQSYKEYSPQAQYMRAKLFHFEKNIPEAIAILESLSIHELNEKSLSLLAVLKQKNSDYKGSKFVYEKLILIDDKNSNYWLGLAISLDALGKSSFAVSAYNKALKLNLLDDTAKVFALDRIQEIKKNNSQSRNVTEQASSW